MGDEVYVFFDFWARTALSREITRQFNGTKLD
jgi:peroxiredoxin family protein